MKKAYTFICLLFLLGARLASADDANSENAYVRIKADSYFQFVEDVKQLEGKARDLKNLNDALNVERDRLAEDNKALLDKVQYYEIKNRNLTIAICVSVPVAVGVGFVSHMIWRTQYELRE